MLTEFSRSELTSPYDEWSLKSPRMYPLAEELTDKIYPGFPLLGGDWGNGFLYWLGTGEVSPLTEKLVFPPPQSPTSHYFAQKMLILQLPCSFWPF